MALMLFVLALGAAVATFLESIYDVQTARILVYNSHWYEIVMLLLVINLSLIIYKNKMWKKPSSFVLHLSFIIIAIGAFSTRYFGQEGIIHLRNDQTTNEMLSINSYLQVRNGENIFEYPLNMSKIGNNHFSLKKEFNGKILDLSFDSFIGAKAPNEYSKLFLKLKIGKDEKIVLLEGGAGWIAPIKDINLDGENFSLSWGSKYVKIPFKISLDKFELKRYPGSQSPSSYASFIKVFKGENSSFDYKIYMNHPLSFKGYKIFQSSYDKDENGTILEVNNDPGKIPTYIGYFLLTLGFCMNLLSRKSRFMHLIKFLKSAAPVFVLFMILGLNSNLFAQETPEVLNNFKKNSFEHANKNLSTLLVQDLRGRTKPFSTQSEELVYKITGQNSLFGLSSEQIILGMSTNPVLWRDLKIIKIKDPKIKELLNLDKKQNFVSFNEVFDSNGEYKLNKVVKLANEQSASKRSKFQNDLIKFDERLNIAYFTFRGLFLRFIPELGHDWLSPGDAFKSPNVDMKFKIALNEYFSNIQDGLVNNNWQKASSALEDIKVMQRELASYELPSENKIRAEIFYNKADIFYKLIYFYLALGFASLILGFIKIFTRKEFSRISKILFGIFSILFIIHTLNLALRWYISGHAPWSDAYESLVYIAWSALLGVILFFRKSLLTMATASIIASIILLVALMNFVNPQITNLVPVLKSYWLTIHVSIITASYGFLALGAFLGLINLILMICKNEKNSLNLNNSIRQLAAIDEISLIVGLAMLTVGNFFGGIWANESWGRYWGWDPKETWSFISILIYAIIIHLRFIPKFNSIYAFSVASVFGLYSVLMTYFGVNFYLSGLHSYAATGEAPGIPNSFFVISFLLVMISILAYKGRKIKNI